MTPLLSLHVTPVSKAAALVPVPLARAVVSRDLVSPAPVAAAPGWEGTDMGQMHGIV